MYKQQQYQYEDDDGYCEPSGHRHDEDGSSSTFRRQRSTRRMEGLRSSSRGNSIIEAAAKVAAAETERAPSPALHEESLMMGDDEVLEQYRIMAQVEAQIRVKDNTGFDVVEYQKRREASDANPDSRGRQGNLYKGMKAPKPIVPPRREAPELESVTIPEEPPLLLLSSIRLSSTRLMSASTNTDLRIIPEVWPGVVVRGASNGGGGGGGGGGSGSVSSISSAVGENDGEHLVRCLGCRAILKVHRLASLVSCPDCSTISPASSMARRQGKWIV